MGIDTQINQLFDMIEFKIWRNSVEILYLRNFEMKVQVRDAINKKLEGMMTTIEDRLQ
jgi:hypothetical protein